MTSILRNAIIDLVKIKEKENEKREIIELANKAQNWERLSKLTKLLADSGRIENKDLYDNYYSKELSNYSNEERRTHFIYYFESVIFVDFENQTGLIKDFTILHRDYNKNK